MGKLLFNTVRLFKTDALEQVVFHAGRRNVAKSDGRDVVMQ